MQSTSLPSPSTNALKRLKTRVSRIDRLFWLTVVIPTAISIMYFGFVATDVYTSESSFVVRSPERPMTSPLGALLKGSGFSRAQDDSYTVHEYVLSRDALRVLVQSIALDKAFANPDVDRFSRFAGLDPDKSFEALHRYYQKKVSVLTDSTSSITSLSVKAFTARDALNVNTELLKQSETLVNRMNERGRRDLIHYSQAEVDLAQQKAKVTGLALADYRNRQGVVDPERQATAKLLQVAKVQDDLIATTTQLVLLKASTPKNPQIPILQLRATTLEQEIKRETANVTGGQTSLANKASDYQRLAIDAEFANKQLVSALTSLEMARSEALRQQVYLERVTQPSLPDVAQDPKRVRSILATFLMGLVVWGVLSMLIAGVKEHQS
ncbi:hypothetical protein [Candidatus Aalborgicola defluviihabitans]|uniref:hypothetical protein n=1 Tax=Candidatus Aalborgicola defluviihabitans TaxID=3386187 RepID=UPI001D47B1CA|nr:hypothetical protein [Burkholderiales bacterium]MBK6569328.1 hypothetical protein [Burkholderiales bacterium]MBK7280747.1 hypothetical protein [Burkholderiales bacterium]MBL0243972.1 hypothetical protein [Rhodoferax sp.]